MKPNNSQQSSLDEAIAESFPASDPPAWTVAKTTPKPAHEPLQQTISLKWERNTPDFAYETYNREGEVKFAGGDTLLLSNPAEFYGDNRFANAEELLLAAVAFCYMHTLLAIASKQKYSIQRYTDHATAKLEKNESGQFWISEVQLHPEITVDSPLTEAQVEHLKNSAEKHCFIANSLNSKMIIQLKCRS
ncbi:MAG: OsmC family protein [Gammaproteobacteria bacterium]